MPQLMFLVALYLLVAATDGYVVVLAWRVATWAWSVDPVLVSLVGLAWALGIAATVPFLRDWSKPLLWRVDYGPPFQRPAEPPPAAPLPDAA